MYGQTRHGLEMLVSIRGENLTEIHHALKEWRVNWIAEFDPQEHDAPTDDNAPFIKSITIHTTRAGRTATGKQAPLNIRQIFASGPRLAKMMQVA